MPTAALRRLGPSGLLLALLLAAPPTASAFAPLALSDAAGAYRPGAAAGILEDPGGHLTIDEVAGRDDFVAPAAEVPNFGLSTSAFWIRLPLRAEHAGKGGWLLEGFTACLGTGIAGA